jgi:hypothetical protein
MEPVTRSCQHEAIEVYVEFIYLLDRVGDLEFDDHSTDENLSRRIITGQCLVLRLERNTIARVDVEIHDAEPAYNPDDWDHIAEASLDLPTGQLQVAEVNGTMVEFTVAPGSYRVRSFRGGCGTIDEPGWEGFGHYVLVLWPAPHAEVRVIKQTPRVPPALIFEAPLRRALAQ